MKTKLVDINYIHSWVQRVSSSMDMAGHLFLGGERLWCCDEAIITSEWGRAVGAATIAPDGECSSGEPTIVAVYVLPQYRNHGREELLLEAAVERCVERGFNKVRFDMTVMDTINVNSLSKETLAHLDIHQS